jgi:hypothetical protein
MNPVCPLDISPHLSEIALNSALVLFFSGKAIQAKVAFTAIGKAFCQLLRFIRNFPIVVELVLVSFT